MVEGDQGREESELPAGGLGASICRHVRPAGQAGRGAELHRVGGPCNRHLGCRGHGQSGSGRTRVFQGRIERPGNLAEPRHGPELDRHPDRIPGQHEGRRPGAAIALPRIPRQRGRRVLWQPRARRWGLWLDLASWEKKYEQMRDRRTVGAMFVAEVVGHAGRYPSIRLPDTLPDQGAEEKLAGELKSWIERHGLTLAEDQSLRDALKAFAAANTVKVRQTGAVTLSNGLTIAFDPETDKKEAEERDAWAEGAFHKDTRKMIRHRRKCDRATFRSILASAEASSMLKPTVQRSGASDGSGTTRDPE